MKTVFIRIPDRSAHPFSDRLWSALTRRTLRNSVQSNIFCGAPIHRTTHLSLELSSQWIRKKYAVGNTTKDTFFASWLRQSVKGFKNPNGIFKNKTQESNQTTFHLAKFDWFTQHHHLRLFFLGMGVHISFSAVCCFRNPYGHPQVVYFVISHISPTALLGGLQMYDRGKVSTMNHCMNPWKNVVLGRIWNRKRIRVLTL